MLITTTQIYFGKRYIQMDPMPIILIPLAKFVGEGKRNKETVNIYKLNSELRYMTKEVVKDYD